MAKIIQTSRSGFSAIVRRVTAILCVPLVRSRRRQLLKTTKPPPDAKGGGPLRLLFILRYPSCIRTAQRKVLGCCRITNIPSRSVNRCSG